MFTNKLARRIKNKVWEINHHIQNRKNRQRLTNKNVSILSSNCTGGILYHDLGMEFLSPTINLFMRAEDYIRFCEHLEYYLSIDEMTECTDSNIIGERTYPIAYLGDLILFLVHYHSVQQAQEKWNARKKRISRGNIVILSSDRDGKRPIDQFDWVNFLNG